MKLRFKLAIVGVISIVSFGFSVNKSSATVAWPDIVGFAYGQMLDEMAFEMHGAVLGTLKQAAAEMINDQVDSLLSGSSRGGSLIIQDWDEYLFDASRDEIALYTNDLISASVGGKNSRVNYISNSGDFNYSRYLTEYAKSQVIGSNSSVKKNSFIDEIIGDPTSSLSGTAGWRMFSALRETNPMGSALKLQTNIIEEQRKKEKEAEIKAIVGGGYEGVESNGKTITPGSTVKSLKEESMAMAFEMISSANYTPEVITSVLSKFILQTFQKGIGQAQSNVSKEEKSTPQVPSVWKNPNNY
ncbi:MAG: hypothetical protein M0P97_00600 [Candidatus Moranbacteria bacterium]|jgi:hypothetical protein|nr:hypothetical protein [Candidatus Moranbacteria bacterium]